MIPTSASGERTFACSVVFLDIVGYSKEPIEQQMDWKRLLNSYLQAATVDTPYEERIILDTGDGAIISFLNDPESALRVALAIRNYATASTATVGRAMQLRIGINLGAVKIVKDVNQQPNLVGDGINVGQRIMSFAEPNQVVVSRSFYDIVAWLSHEQQSCFKRLGIQRDKHNREHELYLVCESQETVSSEKNQPLSLVISPGELGVLESALKQSLGPIATILLRRALSSAVSIEQLIETLAETIGDAREQSAFRQATQELRLAQRLAKPQTAPEQKTLSLAPDVLTLVEQETLKVLGPVGRILVKRELLSADDLSTFAENLCRHLPTSSEQQDLLRKLRKLLSVENSQ